MRVARQKMTGTEDDGGPFDEGGRLEKRKESGRHGPKT